MDRDLLILARAEMKAQEWGGQNPEYKKLHKEFENTLRDNLKKGSSQKTEKIVR